MGIAAGDFGTNNQEFENFKLNVEMWKSIYFQKQINSRVARAEPEKNWVKRGNIHMMSSGRH